MSKKKWLRTKKRGHRKEIVPGDTVEVIFGNISLYQTRCPECEELSFLDNHGETICCGVSIRVGSTHRAERRSEAYWARRQPTARQKTAILEDQHYRCAYCSCDLNVEPVIHFDHVVPYSWEANNRASNFVATCCLCNQVKADKMFSDFNEAKEHVEKRRRRRR